MGSYLSLVIQTFLHRLKAQGSGWMENNNILEEGTV